MIFWLRYLPRPSWVMPRITSTPSLGMSSPSFSVLFWPGEDRLRQVFADLVGVDVKGGRELDVADVVAAQIDVHEAGDLGVGVGVAVVLHALHERARAVADADDGDPDLVVLMARAAVRGTVVAHWEVPSSKRYAGAAELRRGVALDIPMLGVRYTTRGGRQPPGPVRRARVARRR